MNDMLPIVKFLYRHFDTSSLQVLRNELEAKLRCSAQQETSKRIDEIFSGKITNSFIPVLADALDVEQNVLSPIIKKTWSCLEELEIHTSKQSQSPHIYVETNQIDNEDPVDALVHAEFIVISLPDNFTSQTTSIQLKQAKSIILEHIQKFAGKVPYFGDINGYTYYQRSLRNFCFDQKGQFIGINSEGHTL